MWVSGSCPEAAGSWPLAWPAVGTALFTSSEIMCPLAGSSCGGLPGKRQTEAARGFMRRGSAERPGEPRVYRPLPG